MTFLEQLEALSYLVTVIGLPFGIYVYLRDQRKERKNEEEEVYVRLTDQYAEFLGVVLKNADLQLTTRTTPSAPLTPEQEERRQVLFDILVSLFERAYILVYEDDMDKDEARLWASWHDYMCEWCRRPDFRAALPTLLRGEDPDFAAYIMRVAEDVAKSSTDGSQTKAG
ncbi:MAG: hypothetical protein MUE42_01225 [Opitutaceae bacterium]|jgi:hypothetical protein|nr:hypothetical protein [Opitutaceae bacterium]